MKTTFLVAHLGAVLLAALALWSMRHELSEKAANRFEWMLPPMLAVVVAAVLLIVSPGKRFELWTLAIAAGLVIGLVAGMVLRVVKDFAQNLVRVRAEFERVRQQQQIYAVARNRQIAKFGAQLDCACGCDPVFVRDAACAQEIMLGQPKLQRVEPEHVGDGFIDVALLALDQIAPERRVEPIDRRLRRGLECHWH